MPPIDPAAPRYGDTMRPLDLDSLALVDEHRQDPVVLRFIELLERTARAEKISKPET
ncbi:hypothetical protein [Massilia phyllosphaerae]|uniref:hypothetical protein n=1 Tax=Massilia phyllosphaerae TaxID=3106034 RepID=UPI002B1CDCB6|nr:hypothetical protein [Massilia sp. SGZ-792]